MNLGVVLLSVFLLTTSDLQVSEENSLVGIWTVTDFADPELFDDTWEFHKNGKWNELKGGGKDYKTKRKYRMRPGEYGTWALDGNVLTIVCVGERSRGSKRHLCDKPVSIKLAVEKVGVDWKLEMTDASYEHPDIGSVVRLTRKVDGRRS